MALNDGITLGAITTICFFMIVVNILYTNNAIEKRSLLDNQVVDVEDIEKLEYLVGTTTRTIVKLQTDLEQRVRFEGNSGMVEVRSYGSAMHPFHQTGVANGGIMNIHNHANNRLTMGMGEFTAVLNGVQFSTRHNDYKLVQPVAETGEENFHKTREIPLPPVPQSVTDKATVKEQSDEMREYFRAWQNQDKSHRNYEPHFKAILCYLEGAWMNDKKGEIEDFDSDRHFIDAKNWASLNAKTRFLFNSGRKNNLENLPWLPSAFRNIDENLETEMANFEYRILCHPLEDDLPLNRLKLVDRLSLRMKYDNTAYTLEEWNNKRTALFQLNGKDKDEWDDRHGKRQFLDSLMEQIPGKDNYNSHIEDRVGTSVALPYNGGNTPLNTAYYSRFYSLSESDAMGRSQRRRGFNDINLWAAQTTQSRVNGLSFTPDKKNGEEQEPIHQKWTYAIPLEIIYLTPLLTWDPYNLGFETSKDFKPDQNGRNGGFEKSTAFAGIDFKHFFRTPDFFFGSDSDGDLADTSKGVVGVKDKNGNVKRTRASGTYTTLPPIDGIDKTVRLRYPIPPLHSDKQAAMREFKAFEKLFKDGNYGDSRGSEPTTSSSVTLSTSVSTSTLVTQHQHVLSNVELKDGDSAVFSSGLAAGHTHDILVTRSGDEYELTECDDRDNVCWDGHSSLCIGEDC